MWDFAVSRISRLALTVLLLTGLLGYTGASMAGAPSLSSLKHKDDKKKIKDAHHKRSSACFECHKDNQSPRFKKQLKYTCLECHPEGWYKGKLTALHSAEQTRGAAEAVGQSDWPKATGKGPGMRYAMYYAKSRLGDKPNPMITIPAGKFLRGTNERLPDEGPQHELFVETFSIDRYEVTNLQYQRFLNKVKRPPPKHFVNGAAPTGKADHPVTYVSWYDAKAYCEWAGKRLPSDIEWEKAARGSDGRVYPWGNEFSIDKANSPVRWTSLKLVGDTTPVGAFEQGKSVYGVYDMSGNVWEWTSSRYLPYPGNTRKSENYGGNYRTLKGGSWWDCSFYQCGISAPVYNRSFFHPKTKNSSFGFRCAKSN